MTSSLPFPQASQTTEDGILQKWFAHQPLRPKPGFQGHMGMGNSSS